MLILASIMIPPWTAVLDAVLQYAVYSSISNMDPALLACTVSVRALLDTNGASIMCCIRQGRFTPPSLPHPASPPTRP